jgi:radical SAM superfamily enzyme YgiQ (UPF0313 family)
MTELFYSEPVFRPPSEGNSLLLTVSIGCTFNCTFCYPYKHKKFSIRNIEDIKQDIDISKKKYGDSVRKIFLLDGNAFIVKPDKLIEISNYCYKQHKNLKRVSAYAHANDIISKSDEDLLRIAKSGLNMVYLGIETGDNDLLKLINKKTTAENLIKAAHKLHNSGIILSGTIILGLAGNDPELSKKHALSTAKLINEMNPKKNQPWYISALSLMLPPGTELEKDVKRGAFKPLNQKDTLKELKIFLENISDDLHSMIFRSNHASNYLALKGVLAKDKNELVQKVKYGLSHPESLRPEYYRGL